MKKQSKKYLWGALIVIAVLVGIKVIVSSTAPVEEVTDAKLTISEQNWDFGDIPMSQGIITRSVYMENETDVPITITNLETSCMCTSAQIVHSDGSKSGLKGMAGMGSSTSLSETISAGEVATLLVNFDPNAHGPNATGPITRTVELQTNSRIQPKIKLSFSGNVVK